MMERQDGLKKKKKRGIHARLNGTFFLRISKGNTCQAKQNFFLEDIQGLRRAASYFSEIPHWRRVPGHGAPSTELCDEAAEAAVTNRKLLFWQQQIALFAFTKNVNSLILTLILSVVVLFFSKCCIFHKYIY